MPIGCGKAFCASSTISTISRFHESRKEHRLKHLQIRSKKPILASRIFKPIQHFACCIPGMSQMSAGTQKCLQAHVVTFCFGSASMLESKAADTNECFANVASSRSTHGMTLLQSAHGVAICRNDAPGKGLDAPGKVALRCLGFQLTFLRCVFSRIVDSQILLNMIFAACPAKLLCVYCQSGHSC